MSHKYDYEAVQEILTWAKDMLRNKTYPQNPYQLNRSTKILDCAYYLDSAISTISRHWENPTFHPTIDHLWEFKEKLKSDPA